MLSKNGDPNMKKIQLRKSIVLAALCLPALARAGGLYMYEIGTSDLGFAGAGTAARAEDASTVYANPAGMTRLSGNQLVVGGQALYGKADYELDGGGGLAGGDPGNVIGWLPGGSLFYSHSIDDRLKLGVGVYGNFGLALDFGDNWAGRNLVDKAAMMAMTIQPTLAYRLDDRWSLGAGLTANYGLLKIERVALIGGGKQSEKDTDWQYGARLGVMFEPSKSTRIGVVWTSEVEYDFNVVATVPGILPGRTHRFPVGASVNSPQQVMASAYHALNDRWAVTGNLGWQDWSRFSQNSIETNAGTTTSSLKLQDTWHVALGAQYQYSAKARINAGIAYDNSFYKDQDRTMFAMPNGDTWRFGTGVQYVLSPKSELGLAAEYARSDSSSDPSRLLSGTYDHPYMVFLSAHYSHRF